MPPSAQDHHVPPHHRHEELVAPIEAHEVAIGQQRLGGAAELQIEHLPPAGSRMLSTKRWVHDQLAVSALRLVRRLPSGASISRW
jgi:hypothetical protein